jgi:hypothetical protein
MTRFFVKREAGVRETVGALAVAVSVGSLSFYLARMLLAREGVESKAPPRITGDPGRRLPAGSEGD